jgi:hypothetical protein
VVERREPKELVALVLAAVIILVWALAALRAVADTNYNMPDFLTPLMGSVVTWCFVGDVVRKVRSQNDEQDKPATKTQDV